jgi:hypothetical protein
MPDQEKDDKKGEEGTLGGILPTQTDEDARDRVAGIFPTNGEPKKDE